MTSCRSHGGDEPALLGACGHGGAYSTGMDIDPEHGLIYVFMVQHAGFGGKDGGKQINPTFRKAAVAAFGKP